MIANRIIPKRLMLKFKYELLKTVKIRTIHKFYILLFYSRTQLGYIIIQININFDINYQCFSNSIIFKFIIIIIIKIKK